MPVIVDDSAVLKPFELARALIEYGFRVVRIVASECPDIDGGNMEWVVENAPDVEIAQPEHHNAVLHGHRIAGSLAIGLDGAYLSNSDYLVDMLSDAGMYGYHGISRLMSRVEEAARTKADLRYVIESYGLVV
jgi:hypothetical protein